MKTEVKAEEPLLLDLVAREGREAVRSPYFGFEIRRGTALINVHGD